MKSVASCARQLQVVIAAYPEEAEEIKAVGLEKRQSLLLPLSFLPSSPLVLQASLFSFPEDATGAKSCHSASLSLTKVLDAVVRFTASLSL